MAGSGRTQKVADRTRGFACERLGVDRRYCTREVFLLGGAVTDDDNLLELGLVLFEYDVNDGLHAYGDCTACVAYERELQYGIFASQLEKIGSVLIGIHTVGRTFFDDAGSDDGVSGGILHDASDRILLGRDVHAAYSERNDQNNNKLPPVMGGVNFTFIKLGFKVR